MKIPSADNGRGRSNLRADRSIRRRRNSAEYRSRFCFVAGTRDGERSSRRRRRWHTFLPDAGPRWQILISAESSPEPGREGRERCTRVHGAVHRWEGRAKLVFCIDAVFSKASRPPATNGRYEDRLRIGASRSRAPRVRRFSPRSPWSRGSEERAEGTRLLVFASATQPRATITVPRSRRSLPRQSSIFVIFRVGSPPRSPRDPPGRDIRRHFRVVCTGNLRIIR